MSVFESNVKSGVRWAQELVAFRMERSDPNECETSSLTASSVYGHVLVSGKRVSTSRSTSNIAQVDKNKTHDDNATPSSCLQKSHHD